MSSSRVLIVEDDEAIASLVQRTLSEAGIESDIATTGTEGLWRAREVEYGVIVLDLLLPEMNGYVVCRTLREEGNSVAILMLTAKSGEYDETEGFEMGADDYLRKPFSPAVLIARAKALLRRTPSTTVTEVLSCGDLRFDLAARRCWIGEDLISLTAREGTLLEVLLRSGETPLSRLQLLDQVWGFDFDGDPNVVDVYIGYIRKKLGRDRVENVRSVGFRLVP